MIGTAFGIRRKTLNVFSEERISSFREDRPARKLTERRWSSFIQIALRQLVSSESAKISAAIERDERKKRETFRWKVPEKELHPSKGRTRRIRRPGLPDEGRILRGQSSLWSYSTEPGRKTKRGNNNEGFFASRFSSFPIPPTTSLDPFILAASQQVWNYIG